MWVRSQTGVTLVKCNYVEISGEADTNKIIGGLDGDDNCYRLGIYDTSYRTNEIMDEIQKAIIDGKIIFNMPKE